MPDVLLDGNLDGSGSLAGDLALLLVASGALFGSGDMAGTMSLTEVLAGNLTGAGDIAGPLALTLAFNGALSGAGTVASNTVNAILGFSGTLGGSGDMAAATLNNDLLMSGSLQGSGTLAVAGGYIRIGMQLGGNLTGEGRLNNPELYKLVPTTINTLPLSSTLSNRALQAEIARVTGTPAPQDTTSQGGNFGPPFDQTRRRPRSIAG